MLDAVGDNYFSNIHYMTVEIKKTWLRGHRRKTWLSIYGEFRMLDVGTW